MTAFVDEFMLCVSCDSDISHEDSYKTLDGGVACLTCIEEDYDECSLCDLHTRDATTVDLDRFVCPDCLSSSGYYECSQCDTLITTGELCSYHRDHFLDNCDDIEYSSYKPEPVFHGTGPLYLGLELEINVPRGEARACVTDTVQHLQPLGYLKEDGSITHGFELVTHPMSYSWALRHFPWDLLSGLARRGCHGDGTGLHVHVDREAFTDPCHVFRWMKFIHRNAEAVKILARRESDQWAAFTEYDRSSVKRTCKDKEFTSRYSAINTQNDTTFELRMFASSVVPQQVQAALAFAAASIEYTKQLTVSTIVHDNGWAWDAFTVWLRGRSQYAPLTREWEELACAC